MYNYFGYKASYSSASSSSSSSTSGGGGGSGGGIFHLHEPPWRRLRLQVAPVSCASVREVCHALVNKHNYPDKLAVANRAAPQRDTPCLTVFSPQWASYSGSGGSGSEGMEGSVSVPGNLVALAPPPSLQMWRKYHAGAVVYVTVGNQQVDYEHSATIASERERVGPLCRVVPTAAATTRLLSTYNSLRAAPSALLRQVWLVAKQEVCVAEDVVYWRVDPALQQRVEAEKAEAKAKAAAAAASGKKKSHSLWTADERGRYQWQGK